MFENRMGAIATMHAKERVMAPLLEQGLQIQVVVPEGLNTEAFGTFTREVARAGSQLDAARLKAEKALHLTGLSLAFASEGTFGPHPALPYLPCNRELVLMLDRETGLELVGEALSTETNFKHQVVQTVEAALQFAQTVGFPDHGLVVRPEGSEIAESPIVKGIAEVGMLEQAVAWAIAQSSQGKAWIETDMRAMMNPTRMQVIAQATQDLLRKIWQTCPNCGWPGFDVTRQLPGLPCELCGLPTTLTLTAISQCQKCGYQHAVEFPNGVERADPAQCQFCNP